MTMKKDRCQSKRLLKVLLSMFNFVFWFTGPGVLGLGIWLDLVVQELEVALEHAQFQLPAYFLMVTGGLVIIFGIIGCLSIYNEQGCLLSFYIFCLIVAFAGEMTACIKTFLIYDEIESLIEYRLENIIRYTYTKDVDTMAAFDSLQQQYECCGVYNSSDWLLLPITSVPGIRPEDAGYQLYPTSCCSRPDTCSRITEDEMFSEGCLPILVDKMRLILRLAGWSSFTVASLLIIGCVMVCCYRLAVKR